MSSKPPRCACGARAITRCIDCGATLCEEHAITGINAARQKEDRCARCDRERYRRPRS